MLALKEYESIVDKADSKGKTKALKQMAISLHWHSLALLGLCTALFLLVPIFVLLATVDVYRGGCTGCRIDAELVFAFLTPFFPAFFLSLRLVIVLENDEFGVAKELQLMFVFGGVVILVGILLVLFNPNSTIPFEWVVWLGFFNVLFIWVPVQIVLARGRIKKTHQLQVRSEHLNLGTLVQSLNDASFLNLAEKEYVMESVFFVRDVESFKRKFSARSLNSRLFAMQHIINRYIRESAPMEINISWDMRNSLIAKCESMTANEVPSDIFDKAELDVANMLIHGTLASFVLRTNLHGYRRMEKLSEYQGHQGIEKSDSLFNSTYKCCLRKRWRLTDGDLYKKVLPS